MTNDYIAVNLANWNSRVPFHEQGYGLDAYRADATHLSKCVHFDLPHLGDVSGLVGVHLQCHLGTDTLSLARLGARMTGLDFSAPALAVARKLAADCGAAIDYVEAELYGAVDALGEGHPMLWSLCEPRPDGLVVVDYPYFETARGTTFVATKTYVEHEGELASPASISYNHALAEIVTALLDAGLVLMAFAEHQSAPWDFLPGATVADQRGEYRLRERPERLAASYTLVARKP